MKRSWRIPLIGAFFILTIVLLAAVTFYTDWQWFGETGYQEIFVTRLTAQAALGGGAVAFGLLLLNLRNSKRVLVAKSRGQIWLRGNRVMAVAVSSASHHEYR